ncbi:Protein W02A2.5 [Aphelenchoides avenae]|nr:Protein W02A2.5 [Aphelenchus avenae]
MDKWPIANVSSVTQALDLVNSGNYVLIAQEDDNVVARLSSEKFAGYCDILFISEGLPLVSAHFVFRQDNPLTPKFDEAIKKEEVTIMRIVRRYFANAQAEREMMCGRVADAQKARVARPLGLVPYLGLILVCSAGGLLAILAFAVEIAAHRRNRSNVRKSKLFTGRTQRGRRESF